MHSGGRPQCVQRHRVPRVAPLPAVLEPPARRQDGGAPENGVAGGGQLDNAAARQGLLPHQPHFRPPADAQTVLV